MDRFDPNEWTPAFVSSNQIFCVQVLQDTCGTIVDLVRGRQYKPAVAGLDRLLNGLILMQNHGSRDFGSHICFCSWAEAEIIAFGMVDAPEDKRREIALKLYEDARDFAQSEKTKAIISAAIRDLRSGKPLNAVQQTHDPDFPGSIPDILETVREKLAPSSHASAQPSRSSTPQVSSGESGRGILPTILIVAILLGLALFILRMVFAPKKVSEDTPTPIQTTEAPQIETTEITEPTEAPTEAPTAANYVIKTEFGSGLNLREGPSTDAPVITAMEEYSVVTVLEVRDGWAYISIGDLTGWCSMDYLVPEESFSREDNTLTATVTTEGDELRLRTEPSLDSDVIDGMPNGASVTVLRQEGEWCYVDYYGTQGWCSSEYLTFP